MSCFYMMNNSNSKVPDNIYGLRLQASCKNHVTTSTKRELSQNDDLIGILESWHVLDSPFS